MSLSKKNYSVRGFLIVLVILGHVLTSNPMFVGRKFLYLFIYSFHMPLFMMLSGYYGYTVIHKGYKDVFKSTFMSLVIPFIIVSYALRLFNHFVLGANFKWNIISHPSFALWFLLALIFYRLTTKLIVKIPGYIYFVFLSSMLFMYLPPQLLQVAGFSRIFSFMIFYYVGLYIRENNINPTIFNSKKKLTVISGIVITLLICILSKQYYDVTGKFFRHEEFSYFRQLPIYVNISLQTATFVISMLASFFIYSIVGTSEKLVYLGLESRNLYLGHIFFISLLKTDVYKEFTATKVGLQVLFIDMVDVILIVCSILLLLYVYRFFSKKIKLSY